MKRGLLLISLLLIAVLSVFNLYNCDYKKSFNHNLPSNHPLVKIQDRLEEIINYSKDGVVKISGGERADIILDFNNFNYRDWIIGSGFIFKKDDKFLYIMTNYHVVDKIKNIRISFNNGYEADGKLVGKDKATDIAVIRVKLSDDLLKNLEPLPLRKTSKDVKPGDIVLVAGIPYNLKLSYTLGIVSALNVNPGISEYEDYIQVNASINPGNSGGPVLDIYGYVIGMCVATVQYGQGLGFVIPSETLEYVAEELIKYGKVRRGWIGVTVDSAEKIRPDKVKYGVMVISVEPNSPAEKSGIKTGDIILQIDNTKIIDADNFKEVEERLKPGQVIRLKILRSDGKEHKTIILYLKTGEKKEDDFDKF